MKQDIWILEDGAIEADLYRVILGTDYNVQIFSTLTSFSEALVALGPKSMPALLIADLKLGDNEDFSVFIGDDNNRALLRMPFIVTSSFDDPETMQFCLASGASDYLVKPFNRNELLLKIKRTLTLKPSLTNYSEFGDDLKYTLKERIIIEEFLKVPSRKVLRTQIAERLWPNMVVEWKTLDVHMSNLRRKLQESGYTIAAVSRGEWGLMLWDGVESDSPLPEGESEEEKNKKKSFLGIHPPHQNLRGEGSDAVL